MTSDQTRPAKPADQLQYAMRLARTGRRQEARDVLRRVVASQPLNQPAWFWLAAITTERAEAEAALAQARKIDPSHPSLPHAEQWLAERFSTRAGAPVEARAQAGSPSPRSPFHLINSLSLTIVVVVIGLGLLLLFVGLALDARTTVQARQSSSQLDRSTTLAQTAGDQAELLDLAWKNREWPRAISILEEIYRTAPNVQAVRERLALAYIQQGITLRHKGYVEESLPYFEQVLLVIPDQARAKNELRLASNYLEGVQHYQAGQWQKGIQALEQVRREDSDYVNVADLLYSAYYNQGLALQAAGQLSQAGQALEAAIALRPDLVAPRQQMAEIEFAMSPDTPLEKPIPAVSARDQLIVVGIVEQRMLVYEGDRQIFDFVISTGEPGRDTAVGDFEILNKIDLAYASTWNLDMPYWMGIYWAGPLQNGIHSLPIVRHTGYKLWDGYLGQRVSYGCVILSDEDAATLYDWTQVGARVKIVWSLANWSLEDEG